MNINSVVWKAFASISSINNKGCQFKDNLNKIILGCYNTIVSFIKPIFDKNINYIGLKKAISNVENKVNLNGDKIPHLNEIKNSNKIESDEAIDSIYANARRKLKSDEIKESVINDIIDNLTIENKVNQGELNEFKKELIFNSKWVLFSGNANYLDNSKIDFLNSIVDTILNSNDEIKPSFGDVSTYKVFLSQEINYFVKHVLYGN
ncbi:hypothetical protein [Proteus sp. FME41]|uniref:hypothetical protein n=1 Tax=Proteus sp. FME41 TaxID=2742608 RepID=UPI001868CCC6|nr:hypothetical protein [Proteus sp. FME41]